MANRGFSPIFFFLPVAALIACSGDGSDGSTVKVKFQVFRDGGNVACSSIDDIKKTEVSLRSGGGIFEVTGFPREVSCADGMFELSVKEGEYLLQITAYDETSLELYQARRNIVIPDSNVLEFSLEPQKARLHLNWSFETMDDLTPCTDQVAELDLTVAASGASGDAYNARLKCTDGPVWLDRYFSPRTYTVLLIAISPDGYTVFKKRETRVLERGQNEYHAILDPEGGRLMMEWQFRLPSGTIVSDCNEAEVVLDEIELTVSTDLGDDPVKETIACAQNGTYVSNTKRFTKGSPLKFELLGNGAHRYRYYEFFLMPDGDKNFELVTLEPVGNASLIWSKTATSGCQTQENFSYHITVTDEEDGEKVLEAEASQSHSNHAITDLPYGSYMVDIVGKNEQSTFCQVSGLRVIDRGGDNAWAAFEL